MRIKDKGGLREVWKNAGANDTQWIHFYDAGDNSTGKYIGWTVTPCDHYEFFRTFYIICLVDLSTDGNTPHERSITKHFKYIEELGNRMQYNSKGFLIPESSTKISLHKKINDDLLVIEDSIDTFFNFEKKKIKDNIFNKKQKKDKGE